MNMSDFEYPPHACVPWFVERYALGDYVEFMYDGGLGGVYEIKGEIVEIDTPFIKVSGKEQDWLMGDIIRIRKT